MDPIPDDERMADAGPLSQLVARMVADRQLSAADALAMSARPASAPDGSEAAVLRWLAAEYELPFSDLEDVDPDKQVLSLFPARILLKEELLPLRRVDGAVEIATSRLFSTQGLDVLKTMTGLRLQPVLAPRDAIVREMKKRLGVGALGDDVGSGFALAYGERAVIVCKCGAFVVVVGIGGIGDVDGANHVDVLSLVMAYTGMGWRHSRTATMCSSQASPA